MRRAILVLALVSGATGVLALDGRSVGPLEGGSEWISHSGTDQYSAYVLFKRVHATQKIDFEKGTVALSPAKAAAIAQRVLGEHFPDVRNAHIEEVTLHTYKLDDGQYGFYTVKFQSGEKRDRRTFLIPVLLDGEPVVPTSKTK